jgi:hypothetical protein
MTHVIDPSTGQLKLWEPETQQKLVLLEHFSGTHLDHITEMDFGCDLLVIECVTIGVAMRAMNLDQPFTLYGSQVPLGSWEFFNEAGGSNAWNGSDHVTHHRMTLMRRTLSPGVGVLEGLSEVSVPGQANNGNFFASFPFPSRIRWTTYSEDSSWRAFSLSIMGVRL